MAELTPEEAVARVQAVFGTEIYVKPLADEVPEEEDSDSDAEIVDLLTRVCYFYPQYTLEDAERLTNSQVTALLVQAEKQRAIEFYNLTLIAAAPYTKNGELVEKLTSQYREIAEG